MKKCKACIISELFKEFKSCEDPEEKFRLKILIVETIMGKCFDCYYWKDPRPVWHEDVYRFKGE